MIVLALWQSEYAADHIHDVIYASGHVTTAAYIPNLLHQICSAMWQARPSVIRTSQVTLKHRDESVLTTLQQKVRRTVAGYQCPCGRGAVTPEMSRYVLVSDNIYMMTLSIILSALPFVGGIHRPPMDFPHKGPVRMWRHWNESYTRRFLSPEHWLT